MRDTLWDSPVTLALRQREGHLFHHAMGTRIVLLPQIAADVFGDNARSEVQQYDRLISATKITEVQSFSRLGSPFLSLSINRAFQALGKGDRGAFADACRYATAHAFDSFYSSIPDGFECHFEGWKSELLILPRLLVEAKGLKSCFSLARRSPATIEICEEDGKLSGSLSGKLSSMPHLKLSNGPVLLLASSPGLYEPEYIGKVHPEVPDAKNFARLIDGSLDVIEAVWPDLSERLNSEISYYVPIKRSDVKTHNSFSAENLVGVIFLSESYDDLKLSEAIVHEYHHNELYRYMMNVGVITDGASEKLFYSPWRADARPLFGLIHALYVFTGVSAFFRSLCRASSDEQLRSFCAFRQKDILERLAVGCAQVQMADLDTEGQALIFWIRERLRVTAMEFEVNLGQPTGERLAHMATWKQSYPELYVQ